MIAALFVETDGCYFNRPDVDPWDEKRDARRYAGPGPAVAHPPCQRWGRFWHGSTRKPHQFKMGDDKGCFAAALATIRRVGGVIEHPADSHAWDKKFFDLTRPPRSGGWVADGHGGWTCYVEQGHYGHVARKGTWLLVYGLEEDELPALIWGEGAQRLHPRALELHGYEKARRIGMMAMAGGKHKTRDRNATPVKFRDLLLHIARLTTPLIAFKNLISFNPQETKDVNLKLTIGCGSLGALQALSNLLEENGYDEETGEFGFYDGDSAPLAAPAVPAPPGVPLPPSASAPPKRESKKAKADREAAEAAAKTDVFTGDQSAADAAIPPGLAALAGVPQPPPAAPGAPAAPAAPPAPPAAPAPVAAATAAFVSPEAYVAPAAITIEALQAAMANFLATGAAASVVQAFLMKNTGFKAIKDLPPEWYPVTHWCLSTGQNREGV